MALQPLAGFRSLPTHHCVTGSLRHIYEHHRHSVSEEMLLGLGEGVGFVYWHMKGTPPIYGGRANVGRPGEEGLEKAAGRRTGVRVEAFSTASPGKAEKALLEMLEAGEPAMLQVDMGYLPYLGQPAGYHFGGHVVVAAGLDREAGQVLIADRDEPLHTVSLVDLAQARGSKHKPFPPLHTWYSFDFADRRPPRGEEIMAAISAGSRRMLQPPIANLGVKGIRRAAEETLRWPKLMNPDELKMACFNAYIFIDATGGTGGGIFRYMYGRFLKEAAAATGEPRLAEVGEEFKSIGDRWQGLPEVVAPMAEIADGEQSAWEKLRGIAG